MLAHLKIRMVLQLKGEKDTITRLSSFIYFFSTIFQLFISFCELHWCQKPTRIPTAHLRFWNFKILLIFVIFWGAVAAARFPSSQTSAAAVDQLFMQMQSLLLHTLLLLSLSLNVQVVQGEIKKFCKNFGSFKFVLLKKFLSYICLNF